MKGSPMWSKATHPNTTKMCIVSGPTTSITATKIFCIPSYDRTRQLTVYSNAVDSPAENLMILPFPISTGDASKIAFETVPKDLFSQCRNSFYNASRRGGYSDSYRSLGFGLDSAKEMKLEIKSHGSYDVVVVPSLDDLSRIPDGFATLTAEAESFIRSSYREGFAFLFCRLKKGSVDYEPFAYSHPIMGSSLFVPTMHFHLHTSDVPAYSSLFEMAFAPPVAVPSRESYKKHTSVWDHIIYTANSSVPARLLSKNFRALPKNRVEWSGFSSPEFVYGPDLKMDMLEIEGDAEPNRDFKFPILDPVRLYVDPALAPTTQAVPGHRAEQDSGLFGYLSTLVGY